MPPKVAAVPYGKLLYFHRFFFLLYCFPFLYRRKIIFEGLVWAEEKIFPQYSIFSTIFTLKVAMDTCGSVILFLEQMAQ